MAQSEVDVRETVRMRRLTVTLYIIDGRETSTLFLRAKAAACTDTGNGFHSFIHQFHCLFLFFFLFKKFELFIYGLHRKPFKINDANNSTDLQNHRLYLGKKTNALVKKHQVDSKQKEKHCSL